MRRLIASGVTILASWATGINELMLLAAVIAGASIAVNAIRQLRYRNFTIDLLVTIASVGAVVIGNYWEAAAVTFLFALGNVLETRTLQQTRRALSDLVEAAPATAMTTDGDEIPLSKVTMGMPLLVKNGMQVPTDGTIIAGRGGIDEATITGESIPADKGEGEKVFAGTWLRSGVLTVQAEGIGADTTLAKIIHRVEEAQDDKAKIQSFMERFSNVYTPLIVLIAAIVGFFDLTMALTFLVIACPGALVISIPVSIVAGIGRAAKDGVLVKGGEYLEKIARVDTLVVDKTGTITHGTPELTDVEPLASLSAQEVLRLAASLEAASEHPLAAAIVRAGKADLPVQDVETIAGKGIAGLVDGQRVEIGLHRDQRLEQYQREGKTAMYVVVDGRPVGIIGVADTVRPEAVQAVHALHKMGIDVVMATGDAQPVADAVAAEVGISQVHAGMLPEGKQELVARLGQDHTVAMIGDGVNDTPALAQADIGIAMGAAGSPAAIETADIALMTDDLARVPFAVKLARRTVGTMRVNVAIALLTVLVLILGTLFGGVTMAIGMLVHEASVVLVILLASLLRFAKFKAPVRPAPATHGQRELIRTT